MTRPKNKKYTGRYSEETLQKMKNVQKGDKSHSWKGGVWTKDKNERKKFYYHRDIEESRRKHRKWVNSLSHRNRLECLVYYSKDPPECACCGESEVIFLTIDHIHGGGRKHRESINGKKLHDWLKREGFPVGYRILCFNCNLAIGMKGACPHTTNKK